MKRKGFAYLDTIACVLVIAAVCMAFTGFWPNQDNPYKSYSLQAMAWLNGRLDLGQDYPWLELAVFQERYYVSFPVEEHIPCHKGAYTGKTGITRDRTGKPWYYRNPKT